MTSLTLDDIAKKAGVSRSTVSRVVNEHPNVRDEVRQRVLDVIHSTGFQPNAAARTLASQRSWMIGLVLPRSVSSFFADPYFPRLTQGIAQTCNQHHYTLALFLVEDHADEENMKPRLSRKGLLDGVLIQAGQMGDNLIDHLINANIPLIVAGRPFQTQGVSYVDVDNVRAAYTAASHLIRLGYKRIATITGHLGSSVSMDRKAGYVKAMVEHGRQVEDSLIVSGDFTEEGGYYAMQTLLPAKPDAVFAASDQMAVGAMRAARQAGLSIPGDIAFVGFDDLPLATMSQPQLTTVRQPIAQLGSIAVEILIDLIENGVQPSQHVILNTELVVRASCGASVMK